MYDLLLRLCKEKGISITNLCVEITGSRGNLTTWKKGNINSIVLSKIADFFEVSADYLLGRTTERNPNVNYGIQNHSDNNQGDITNQLNLQNTGLQNKMITEFEKLNFKNQVKVLNLIAELSETEKK